MRRAALTFGRLLRELELDPWAMATGSRGYHVVVSLQRRADFDAVREFARELAELAAAREPRMFTNEQRKAKREGKILIDVMRNAYAHTSVAPYSVRPRPGRRSRRRCTGRSSRIRRPGPIGGRLRRCPGGCERDGDPWERIGTAGQSLAAPASASPRRSARSRAT